MSDEPTLIYLEADDEITTVVRRVREADPGRIVLVAPGRSRATSSSVALRLLARAATADEREVAVVGDALTRSLAAEAGIATYGSVEDARKADPTSAPEDREPIEDRTAPIHVVRGPVADDTAPTLTAVEVAAAVTREADTEPIPPAPSRGGPPRNARRRRSRRLSWMAIAGAVLAVAVGWGLVAAIVLPAATVTIVPRTEAVGPVSETIILTEVEHVSGTVDETATVTATGTYDVNDPARGRVTFFNFNFFAVFVPTESLVATGEAEGDQAFATVEAITVPAGTFDPFQGGITAGEASVDVVAAAPGPNGNVEAEAIDTVLDDSLEGQLRGFPTIDNALVTNPEPTSGGETATGTEITREDVDAAVAELTDALRAAVADALPTGDAVIHAAATAGAEPEIDGMDELVGTRDTETVQLSGRLAFDEVVAEIAAVEAEAIARIERDPSLLPEGWALDPESTRVTVVGAIAAGEGLEVQVTTTATRAPVIDTTSILPMIVGMERDEAVAALSHLGTATIDLWPAWVSTVPDRAWRVEVEVVE